MIRTDIYAVKVFDNNKWCYSFMTWNKRKAINFAKVMGHRKFVKPKLVHPSQKTVDAFLAVGNLIA